jgi:alpha-mannosidase
MSYSKITVLTPSHSLEDFPTDLGEEAAASLLNAFAVAWHPALLAEIGFLPSWRRADDPPPGPYDSQIVVVPTACDGWLPHRWVEDAREQGATIIAELIPRPDMLAALKLEGTAIDPELVADFLALGTCWLQTELLMRHMRNFGNIDEARLQNRAVAAAKAAVAEDAETATAHLLAAFEIILEARERFYPVECYLLDLCLMAPDQADEHFRRELEQPMAFTLMGTAADWATICDQHPDLREQIRQAWTNSKTCLIGGEQRETNLPLLPLNSVTHQVAAGLATYRQLWDRPPKIWGRRKYGLSAALPQLLTKFGFEAALHVAFDDGIYPDHEHAKLRWQGSDGTVIDAISRIPLAADSATSFLRFPARMSESMDHDQVAGIVFARWPKVENPWFHDFRRIAKYAPVLGRFVTFEQFFSGAESPGRLATYDSKEYLSPFLIQAVARREPDPITRFADHLLRRQSFDAAAWCRTTARALQNQPIEDDESRMAEATLEAAAPPAENADCIAAAQATLNAIQMTWPKELASVVLRGAKSQPGYLIVNTLSFPRIAVVELNDVTSAPAIGGAVKGVQFDPERLRAMVLVDLPSAGFVWIGADERGLPSPATKIPLAEEGVLRNDAFEVAVSDETGGIRQIRLHNTRANRLSQQLSYRFPREKTVRLGPEPGDVEKTQYGRMVAERREIVCAGPIVGEIRTEGVLLDPGDGAKLAGFTQRMWVHRLRPVVELEIELHDLKPPEGDPWNNAFVTRFAWNDSTAAITRSVWHAAQPVGGERFESSDYLEIAEEQDRVTIIPHGLPFHRRTGPRMLDSLLVVEGETRRKFRFTVAIDQPYPLQASREATVPPVVIPTASVPPRTGRSGWFYHLDAKHVQILQLTGMHDDREAPAEPGFAVRLLETEGRAGQVRLQTFQTPKSARKRDFTGATVTNLPIDNDAVVIDLSANELADIELRF